MSTTPPRTNRFSTKNRPLRVLLLGQSAVGKTALTVRFLTKRFIGDYDPTLEQKYSYQCEIDGDMTYWELLDTAGQMEDMVHLEENIRWGEVYMLVYSVNDRCSFDDCTRLMFLINHVRRSRKSSSYNQTQQSDTKAFLVGNKTDIEYERVVTQQDGLIRSQELGCMGSYHISVRESSEQVRLVFHDIYRRCRYSQPPSKPPPVKEQKSIDLDIVPPMPRKRSTALISSSGLSMLPYASDDNVLGGLAAMNRDKEKVKRKQSVSKRIIRRVMPSKLSRESSSELSPTIEVD